MEFVFDHPNSTLPVDLKKRLFPFLEAPRPNIGKIPNTYFKTLPYVVWLNINCQIKWPAEI